VTCIASRTHRQDIFDAEGALCLRAYGLLLEATHISVCIAVVHVSMKRHMMLCALTINDLQVSCLASLAAVQFFVAECTSFLSVSLGAPYALECDLCAHVEEFWGICSLVSF
jgi:hypothetical protein